MCEQSDAMREVRAAAECLSAVCRARTSMTMRTLVRLYDKALEEPVPERLARTIGWLSAIPPER
jgi:hypothetical protein